MSFSPTDSLLYKGLFRDDLVAQLFSDDAFITRLVDVEIALAKVQAELSIIPKDAAESIIQKAASFPINWEQLQEDTEKAGVPIIGLLAQVRKHLGAAVGSYIHWGATTQDIMDTALVLQIRDAIGHLESQLLKVIKSLSKVADTHRHTIMAGRTHSQQALPITFGFKVAGWLAPLLRHFERLEELKARVLVVQLGGAVGTLASLGSGGLRVQQAFAAELGLNIPIMPWHTQRDSLVELANWLSLVSGSLAKIAQDIILMAQTEVAELRESNDPDRGGSSTMPQKSNPIQSEGIIAAARANASLLGTMHQALIQEHERATHGWQLEWLTLPQMLGLTAVCLKKSLWLSENMVVDTAQMQANIDISQGLMIAEAISFELTKYMPRNEAKILVKAGVEITLKEGGHLADIVAKMSGGKLEPAKFKELNYLGETQTFIGQVLEEVKKL